MQLRVQQKETEEEDQVLRQKRQAQWRESTEKEQNTLNGRLNGGINDNRNTIVNLTNIILSKEEESILERGLSYCPASNIDYTQARIDLFKFIRNITSKKIFMLQLKKIGKCKSVQDCYECMLKVADLTLRPTLQELES
ncbi:hypothetical protein NDU88_001849 [Pleurodeles waltl]|uniref:Uncharacterized protein n=1 Tax=Pleurodeles waltl TaxID=8319 RepID=A0AAV7LZ67_PLEWA|nr:hypothetical protein NDU88_001849 [Pleurodeles waltl]